ncbi:MAG: bifunctional diaminohydroxyphosphoribosylaminopyrimidine deaminase/5-amino-6-(5-phosphoribosylamino)uracil reductase RibD [Bacteroidales bacterium]|jgi:diaminohydroxyphosphoribosylaminopyrimidine deaminase/5-amino-6-(5-phosphoribosylamino)uracil reductase|nr:bifunctional diaminohydroxyphosphoribosylaminopyrimidine deaminase/5-amino-6-(5-phosphoribosylamino)uracil reductase RibD [Bacteroidales bacterium]
MQEEDDIKYMRRCLDLALKAEGRTYPNPLVGSVIVHEGRIIGEGYHLKAGEPHAEVIAINSVRDKHLLGKSKLYVNLEPCSHFGKTPPCVDMILSSGIRTVVIGTPDTSEKVSGKGIKKLKESGCEVVTGVMEEECRWINRRFFSFHEKKRPYVILKWAQSADGLLDIERNKGHFRKPLWITGNAERVLVHRWRSVEQSILAGAGTVRADNPRLNVREWTGENPLRLILSSTGNLDSNAALFKTNGINIVFTHNADAKIADAVMVKLSDGSISAVQISDYLYRSDIQSVLIEGGAQVLNHFIASGIWDEARIFRGRDYFNKGPGAPFIEGKTLKRVLFSRSSMEVIFNEHNKTAE